MGAWPQFLTMYSGDQIALYGVLPFVAAMKLYGVFVNNDDKAYRWSLIVSILVIHGSESMAL